LLTPLALALFLTQAAPATPPPAPAESLPASVQSPVPSPVPDMAQPAGTAGGTAAPEAGGTARDPVPESLQGGVKAAADAVGAAAGAVQSAVGERAPGVSAAAGEVAGHAKAVTGAVRELEGARQGAESLADEVAKLTGAQLSPLLVLAALGGARWLLASPEARAALPWHQQPWFFGAAVALLLFLFLGDKVPVLRHAVKQVKLVENKVSGVLAAVVTVGAFAEVASRQAGQLLAAAGQAVVPVALAAGPGAGAEGAAGAAAVAGPLAYGLAVAVGLAISGAVWLLGHSVNVLAVLNPFAPLDSAMRLSRLALVGLVLGAAKVSAVLGLLVAVPCILVAFLVAGWSFRLMVFGLVYSFDLLLGRDEAPGRAGALAFATDGADGVPARTLGRVTWRDGQAVLRYRPWLVLPARTEVLPQPDRIGLGLTGPVLLARDGHHADVLVRFPPRYRRRAGELAAALGGLPVVDLPLLGTLRAAWRWLRGEVEVGA